MIRPLDGEGTEVLTIVPVLNAVSLTDMITHFEREKNFEPVGGYGGLVPTYYRYGPLDQYFMAESSNEGSTGDDKYLLGCICGEVGCWPLTARIVKTETSVVWDHFKQPHRPDRDYSDFGPFIFEIQQYRVAINEVASCFREP